MATKKPVFSLDEFALELAERLKEETQAPNIKKYSPHEKQHLFHKSRKHAKLYIGGNRSGKTTGGVTEAIWRATGTHPYRPELNNLGPTRGRVVGVDFTNGIDKIIIPQFKQWVYPSALMGGSWYSAYHSGSRTLTFSNGSTIEFMSYDQDLDKFAGTSRHWIHFDEEPPKPIWNECMARLIDTGGDYWITMTPVEGMTWIYDDLYEPNVNNLDGNVFIIEINTLENPYLSADAIQQFAGQVDADEISTRVGGSFVQQGGRVYKNFDPTPGIAQVLKGPIDDPKTAFPSTHWLWIMGLDHGLNNPTAVLWMAVDPAGFCVIFDEHYQKELTVDQQARKIHEKIAQHGRMPDLLVADPSIKNRNAITGTSVHEEYQKLGLSFIFGNNDVRAGVVRLKKYFNKHPYIGRTKPSWYTEDSALYYRLRVSPQCVNLIWELKRYRWKTYANKKLQYENNPYDEPHKKDDHACDALRYMIMTRPDLVSSAEQMTGDKLDAAMIAIEQQITTSRDRELADPWDLQGMAAQLGTNIKHMGTPSPVSGAAPTDWAYDEHMGDYL